MVERKARIINLFGGPGCSKSTTAAGVFSMLKLNGVNCELCTEYAKDLTWEDRHKTLENQIYVFGKQYHRLWRVVNSVDIVITDSPLLLSIIYMNKDMDNNFIETVLSTYNSFDNINFYLKRAKKYNPCGRTQTIDEAIELDSDIKNMLHKYNINYSDLYGDFDSINTITSAILSSIGMKNKFNISAVE